MVFVLLATKKNIDSRILRKLALMIVPAGRKVRLAGLVLNADAVIEHTDHTVVAIPANLVGAIIRLMLKANVLTI